MAAVHNHKVTLMKRLVLLLFMCCVTAYSHAKGVPFAVESFQKAQALTAQSGAKHTLVFYTSET